MNIRSHYPIMALLLMVFLCVPRLEAQLLKKLGKKAERAAERTIERRVERETEKKTDAALDSILEPGSKPGNPAPPPQTGDSPDQGSTQPAPPGNSKTTPQKQKLTIYTNYDFVPGSRTILYDDFSVDQLGDFPAKWNTNGSGEVVRLDDEPEKWLKLSNNTVFVPDLPETLPEDYTIEFDLITTGLDRSTSSTARLKLILDDNKAFRNGRQYAEMSLPFAQYTDAGVYVNNHFTDVTPLRNYIKKDVRNEMLRNAHIAVAANGPRFRVWVNERKIVDLPRFMSPGVPQYLKFQLQGMPSETKEQFVFITNLKVAEGGLDLRAKLLKDGGFSTTGILFDTGSDVIKPASYSILKNIADALQQESQMQVKIIGHTDGDGSDDSNLQLSIKRAEAVKEALTGEFSIDPGRLSTDGMGEKEPVASNDTSDGKAKNRRVEFKKQS
ncbi:MAG: OmpA family protein [Flavobacteriaceae bacterium]|nr:OmpA family protein [Flavobacteriaceae bacterium]